MTEKEYRIAGWRFDPTDPVLRGGAEDRRLEDRAARVLAVLCQRRGEVVSKAELIGEVWGGRNVSSNSVSIVIGNLRRALGDDLDCPEMLVTVARRGYRLEGSSDLAAAASLCSDEAHRSNHRKTRWWALAAAAMMMAAAVLLLRSGTPPAIPVLVETPRNETARPELNILAESLGPVVTHGVGRLRNVRVLDSTQASTPRVVVRSRLILWNGAAELALSATDTATHSIIWTSFAAGPPAALARHVDASLSSLQRKLPQPHRF